MSFSYSFDLSVPLNYVRFTVGDTVDEGHVFEDEEIQFFIDKYPTPISERNLKRVAIGLLKVIVRDLLIAPSRERSGTYERYRSDANSLQLLIDCLEDEVKDSIGFASPSFGGVYKREVWSNRCNPAYTPTRFYQGRVYKWDEELCCANPLIGFC